MNDFIAIDYILNNDIEGSLVECGVENGRIEKIWIQKLKSKNVVRDIYLYDTFKGLTKPTEKDFAYCEGPVGEYIDSNKVLSEWEKHNEGDVNKWCYCSLEDVKNALSKLEYSNDNLHYVVGDVRETLLDDKNIPEKIAILRLDTDWYDSTKIELEKLFPRLVDNGVLILDDYFYWNGQHEAVNEYLNTLNEKYDIRRISDSHRAYLIKQQSKILTFENVVENLDTEDIIDVEVLYNIKRNQTFKIINKEINKFLFHNIDLLLSGEKIQMYVKKEIINDYYYRFLTSNVFKKTKYIIEQYEDYLEISIKKE